MWPDAETDLRTKFIRAGLITLTELHSAPYRLNRLVERRYNPVDKQTPAVASNTSVKLMNDILKGDVDLHDHASIVDRLIEYSAKARAEAQTPPPT